MNFSQGHSGTKVRDVNRACFPRKNTRIHKKMGGIHMNFSFWPFLWFGLPGRLLKIFRKRGSGFPLDLVTFELLVGDFVVTWGSRPPESLQVTSYLSVKLQGVFAENGAHFHGKWGLGATPPPPQNCPYTPLATPPPLPGRPPPWDFQ